MVKGNELASSLHPEGLTPEQEILIDMLFTTEIEAPIGKIRILSDGKPEYYKVTRKTTPIAFAQSDDEFALVNHREQIKREEPLSPLSPIYINLRKLPREVYDQMGIVLARLDLPVRPDFCTGIPEAGIPIMEAFSKHSDGIPFHDILEKRPVSAGRGIFLREGLSGRQEKALLLDDLATKADTKLEARGAMISGGFDVVSIAVVVDREQGAREQLRLYGYELIAAVTIRQILQYGLRTGGGGIDQERYNGSMHYLGFL